MNEYPPNDVPAFAFWLMPDEDPQYEDWPHSTPLRAWQRGRCAMCQPTDWFDRDLVEDHDHDTGLIRGLLCRGCNTSEPHNNSPAFVAWRAGFTPMVMLGIEEVYQSPFGEDVMIVRALRSARDRESYMRDLDLIAEAVTR